MANISLIDTPSRAQFFQRAALKNLHYWQAWLEKNLADMAVLDRERNALTKAISFALILEAPGRIKSASEDRMPHIPMAASFHRRR